MTNHIKERLLFVVAVDQAELEKQSTLQTFITQIEHNNAALLRQLQNAIEGEAVLAGQVKLLALANYLNLFVGLIELPSSAFKAIQQGAQADHSFVPALLRAIFAEHQRNLTWTLLRVSELNAAQVDSFALLGMKGIGSRG